MFNDCFSQYNAIINVLLHHLKYIYLGILTILLCCYVLYVVLMFYNFYSFFLYLDFLLCSISKLFTCTTTACLQTWSWIVLFVMFMIVFISLLFCHTWIQLLIKAGTSYRMQFTSKPRDIFPLSTVLTEFLMKARVKNTLFCRLF